METLVEVIRWITSLLALATAAAVAGSVRVRSPILGVWLVLVTAAALVFTHVLRGAPFPALIPLVAGVGLVLGLAHLASPTVAQAFARLDDRQWRLLTATRAAFGALILAAGGVGLFPLTFALPAGVGDLVVGALALAVPGSIAAGGPRGMRALVFGTGLLDFIQVIALQVTVLVPWLAETKSLGISLMLPWVVVPMLAVVNIAGTRLLVKELLEARPTPA